jgi:hypothetical protein
MWWAEEQLRRANDTGGTNANLGISREFFPFFVRADCSYVWRKLADDRSNDHDVPCWLIMCGYYHMHMHVVLGSHSRIHSLRNTKVNITWTIISSQEHTFLCQHNRDDSRFTNDHLALQNRIHIINAAQRR